MKKFSEGVFELDSRFRIRRGRRKRFTRLDFSHFFDLFVIHESQQDRKRRGSVSNMFKVQNSLIQDSRFKA